MSDEIPKKPQLSNALKILRTNFSKRCNFSGFPKKEHVLINKTLTLNHYMSEIKNIVFERKVFFMTETNVRQD